MVLSIFSIKSCNLIKFFLVSVVSLLLLTGCSFTEFTSGVADFSNERAEQSNSTVQNYLETGEVPDIKFDTTSAGEVIEGNAPNGTNIYYDEKSGTYVSAAQYRANHFADSLKVIWIPVCVISFFFGFLIRRLNHSSAAIRKFGLLLEIIIPVALTVFVYIFCALADSSMMNIFDGIF